MLQLSFVGGLTGRYVDFGAAQRAALRMVAERLGRTITDEEVNGLVERMSSLPPHPEVSEALARLREGPLKIAALTNSTRVVAERQLATARLQTISMKCCQLTR